MTADHLRNRKRQAGIAKSQHFLRASELWEKGDLTGALAGFLAGARLGDEDSQLNVGYFYDEGLGTRKDRRKALAWYKRAYRKGNASAASNIGICYRQIGRIDRAVFWLKRAVALGNDDAALELARVLLRHVHDTERAVWYLRRAAASKSATPASVAEAVALLTRYSVGQRQR